MADPTETPRVVINPQVTYDVGDLLDRIGTRIDTGFAEIKAISATKADKVDLAAINATLTAHDARINTLEQERTSNKIVADALRARHERSRDWRRWTIEATIAAIASGGIIAGLR